jgi:hypothetical protein
MISIFLILTHVNNLDCVERFYADNNRELNCNSYHKKKKEKDNRRNDVQCKKKKKQCNKKSEKIAKDYTVHLIHLSTGKRIK